MRVIQSCAECLYEKQTHLTQNEEYLAEIRSLLDNRSEDVTAPYLIYVFNTVYERYFGKRSHYADIKRQYNTLVLSMESAIRERIESAPDPIAEAMLYARIGNYIDFGAMNSVDEKTFLSLFDEAELSENDLAVVDSFKKQCETAGSFLLIADNCGEIVLDRLFLEQLGKKYPQMKLSVLVRGDEVLNDATAEDAVFAGIDRVAEIVSNGLPLAGTVFELLPEKAKEAIDTADLILSKGQGNYESLCGQGRHIFYSLLCKCELFTKRFKVPRLTGLFVEENK